jgi:hypothetical protein
MEIILTLTSKISAFAPVLIALLLIKKWKNVMWWYILSGALAEISSHILKDYLHMRMDIAANLYLCSELLCYFFFFYKILISKWWVLFGFLSVSLLSLFVFQSWDVFLTDQNMFAVGMNCLLFVICSMLVYKKILENPEYDNILKNPVFWLNTGIFIYASCGCIFFIFLDKVRSEDIVFLIQLWLTFYCVINLIRYIFIGIGLNRLGRNERI